MTRKPRIEAAGAYVHVFARGVRKTPIFRDAEDCQYFLNLAGVITEVHGWLVFAYCLMTNHFHLVFLTPEPNLSSGMHRLLGGYAQWFNERHELEGHVFERRFQSVLIEDDARLLVAVRYAVRNPVRAKLCSHPGAWPWSSYRATLGLARAPRLLARANVLEFFAGPGGSAEEHFDRFVLEATGL